MSIADDMFKDISEYLRMHYDVEEDKLTPDTGLEDVGLDSLGLLAIAEILERKYGVNLDDDRIATVNSFSDLVALATL